MFIINLFNSDRRGGGNRYDDRYFMLFFNILMMTWHFLFFVFRRGGRPDYDRVFLLNWKFRLFFLSLNIKYFMFVFILCLFLGRDRDASPRRYVIIVFSKIKFYLPSIVTTITIISKIFKFEYKNNNNLIFLPSRTILQELNQ